MIFDEDRWITIGGGKRTVAHKLLFGHTPITVNITKNMKGRHVLIDADTGEIKKGLSKTAIGQNIKDVFKNGTFDDTKKEKKTKEIDISKYNRDQLITNREMQLTYNFKQNLPLTVIEKISKNNNLSYIYKDPQNSQILAKYDPNILINSIKYIQEHSRHYKNIEKYPIKKLSKKLNTDEIVDKISGGDLTKGSCASAGFTYICNKLGYDVKDFRGDKSQSFFSNSNIITQLLPAMGATIEQRSDLKWGTPASEVLTNLKKLPLDKDFYIIAGKHASIIKNTKNGLYYLELQSPDKEKNGFTSITTTTDFTKRFAYTRRNTYYLLYNIDKCSLKNKNLHGLFSMINTPTEKQQKGDKGTIR